MQVNVSMRCLQSEVAMVNMESGHFKLLDRFKSFPSPFLGSLDLVNRGTYFTGREAPEVENLTSTGSYAGPAEAFVTGPKLRKRYRHLLQVSQPNRS